MIIEVSRNPGSHTISEEELRSLVDRFLEGKDSKDVFTDFKGTPLEGKIHRLSVDRHEKRTSPVYFFYYVNTDGVGNEFVETDSTSLNAALISTLPSKEFEGIWENLHFDSDVKQNLLEYSSKALLFADKGVDHNIISWNKIILMYGPPGTGKTSICKGIAQKLAIRWSSRFESSHFIEVNAHSLFSKFFSESGKLVSQMFERVGEIASDNQSLVFLLIDEVESLAHSRMAAASGNEPSDSIRVVNALLTQLDRLKLLPNVLILTTSNVETSIDNAFVDRADLSVYIGHPPLAAVWKILTSCVTELIEKNLLESVPFNEGPVYTGVWTEICRLSTGLSGRSLRKLPLLAFQEGQSSMTVFLDSLLRIVKAKTAEKKLTQAQQMFQSISLV